MERESQREQQEENIRQTRLGKERPLSEWLWERPVGLVGHLCPAACPGMGGKAWKVSVLLSQQSQFIARPPQHWSCLQRGASCSSYVSSCLLPSLCHPHSKKTVFWQARLFSCEEGRWAGSFPVPLTFPAGMQPGLRGVERGALQEGASPATAQGKVTFPHWGHLWSCNACFRIFVYVKAAWELEWGMCRLKAAQVFWICFVISKGTFPVDYLLVQWEITQWT